MEPIEVLKHLANVCVRKEDGSLSLGTYEVEMIEKAIEAYDPVYCGWRAQDIIDAGFNLGYELPPIVAEALLAEISNKTCEINWDVIYFTIKQNENDLFKYKMGVGS